MNEAEKTYNMFVTVLEGILYGMLDSSGWRFPGTWKTLFDKIKLFRKMSSVYDLTETNGGHLSTGVELDRLRGGHIDDKSKLRYKLRTIRGI